MTRDEFLAAVQIEGIDPRSFTLDGGLPSEQYALGDEGNGSWSTYYGERGVRSGLKVFPSESEALVNLLEMLSEDRTTRLKRTPPPNR